jgi:hypothetical protein
MRRSRGQSHDLKEWQVVRIGPHRLYRPWPLAALALALALVVGAGAMVVSWVSGPPRLGAAPADLQVPPNLGDDLYQWCMDRQAQGTDGLSSAAKSWLRACAEAANSTGNPGPTGTQTQNPTPGPTTSPSATTKPPTTTASRPSGPCPVGGKNQPGAADPWGGCFPGSGNTGVPAGVALVNYTGSCTITTANLVLDHMLIKCSSLDIRATGVVIRNSMVQGEVTDGNSSSASFTITDSTVQNGARDECACVGYHDFTAVRVNVIGGNRSMYCELRCKVQDSWLHGQILTGAQHGSGLREEQYTTATHNTFECSYPYVDDATTLGCSAPQNGYADFAPIHDNTNRNNLYVSTRQGSCATCDPGHANSSFCAYGGSSTGKPYSSDPSNGTHIQFLSNVFQRGPSGVCGDFQTIGNFISGNPGNLATGNLYDDGSLVPANQMSG